MFMEKAINWCIDFYEKIREIIWPESWEEVVKFYWVLLAAFILLVGIIIMICVSVKKRKKRKVCFYVGGSLYYSVKTKYKKAIVFPEAPSKVGFNFVCWALDPAGKKPFNKLVLDRKKRLELHAIFEMDKEKVNASTACPQQVPYHNVVVPPVVVAPQYVQTPYPQPQVQPAPAPQPAPQAEVAVQPAPAPQPAPQAEVAVQPAPVEPVQAPIEYGPQYYYDEIRFAMLGYERSTQYKKLGVQRKQIIAEMFQKDETVYLYLAVDPELMAKKGFKVEKFEDAQFAIVPCKKAINSKEDLEEALALVKEAMTINNLVKSDISYMRKPVSDEQTRKSGFVFFIKNETVATTAEDYYRLLRAIVLSYQKKENVKFADELLNRMILKIYKKGELVYVYLALDPNADGLVNVSYDKNFLDTPAMIEIKTAEDFLKANEFIEKLMFAYGMLRNPAKAEISLDDKIEANCGFGYRIKN